MIDNYVILASFSFSTEAQIIKTKLEAEGIRVRLFDEKTIDYSGQAIAGFKVLVNNDDIKEAIKIYNRIRVYKTDNNGNAIVCTNCKSTKILIAEPMRKNIFYMLFPFFEKTRYRCNVCNTHF